MSINWKYVMGVTTIVGVVAFTAYAIKKSKEQKKIEEESMTAEEAREFAKTYKENVGDGLENPADVPEIHIIGSKETDELMEDIKEKTFEITGLPEELIYKGENNNNEEYGRLEELHIPKEESTFNYLDCDLDNPLAETMTEEDMVLRYEPNSQEARNQFIRMELAEWVPIREEVYTIMLNLFDISFDTENDGDWDLKTKIIDHRVQFFGFGSRWSKEVTMADVILHFAKLAVFNLDESVKFWVEYFLEHNEFEIGMDRHHMDDLVEALNNHTYFNDRLGTYGIFGLSPESMNDAIHNAKRNIDTSVTYEIEFEEFLKDQM